MSEIQTLIEALGLAPHPEGGFYRETYRHQPETGERGELTSIYYLLDGRGRDHRVTDADEVWCFHAGAPLVLSMESPQGEAKVEVLGMNLAAGERPQVIVPRGYWQQAESRGPWTLASCLVAPAFVFDSFEMR